MTIAAMTIKANTTDPCQIDLIDVSFHHAVTDNVRVPRQIAGIKKSVMGHTPNCLPQLSTEYLPIRKNSQRSS